jgi:3-hydroxyacyl-[acyl-carrier-protein] dehydratase
MELTANGTVSQDENFFQDHFPNFPVLPGVLMIELLKRSAETYFPKVALRFVEIRKVRYAHFLKPGETWESRVELLSGDENLSEWKGQLSSAGRPVCSARFQLQKV